MLSRPLLIVFLVAAAACLLSSGEARVFLPGVMDYFACCDTVHRIRANDTCQGHTYGIKPSLLQWKNKKLDCSRAPLRMGMRLCVDNWI